MYDYATIQKMLNEIEKIGTRLEHYDSKKKLMGLDNTEENKYYELVLKGLKIKLHLYDDVYDRNILPYLLQDEALDIYNKINKQLGWECQLLVEESDMKKIVENYNHINKEEVLNDLDKLNILMEENLHTYYESLEDKQLIKTICMFLSNEQTDDVSSLLNHLDYKFEALFTILEDLEVF